MGKNKKIGLLTFHTPDNYGAVYQAYALQKYIKEELGKEIEIIDFCTNKHIKAYSIFKKKSNNLVKDIIYKLIILSKYIPLRKKKKSFELFREKYLIISKKRYDSEESFLNHTERYGTYIVGSDQVFNPYNEYYKAYYLGFEKNNCKKIAYAPSFGISDFSDDITKKILPLIKDFDHLSCREVQGAEYLSRITGKEIPSVVDPVYLLDKREWEKLAKKTAEKEHYIFIYDLCGGEKLISIAKSIAKDKKLKIICATNNIINNYSGCDVKFDIGPLELLGYINNAKYVVTDSFHGTSLSLILQKRIITYIALPHAASRIISIMNFLGISNQIVYNSDNFNIDDIEFKNYYSNLNKLIVNSKEYIQKVLL